MKVTTSTVSDLLSHLRLNFLSDTDARKYEEPYRSELYSLDQMDRHGRAVARSHRLQKERSVDKLLKRLEANRKALLEVFYLIEEQIVIARKHLPKGYSEALPYLAAGVSEGLPRVYDIVLEIISHSDGRVDVFNLTSFIANYQAVSVLTLGELWAIP